MINKYKDILFNSCDLDITTTSIDWDQLDGMKILQNFIGDSSRG